MSPWDLDVNFRLVVLDLLYLSSLILVGTLLRRYVKFFQRFLIPNNLIGGAIGLLICTQGFGWIDMPSERLGIYVYHLLALTFITLGLRQEKKHWGKGPLSKAFAALSSYIVQAAIGLLVAFALIYTVKPDLFAGIGLLVPLGFGMGPGLAYAMGNSWEHWGFEGGGLVGLTFAAIGYLYAFFAGMAIIQWGIRTGQSNLIKSTDHITENMRTGINRLDDQPIAGRLPMSSEAIESMAFQFGLIGFVYLLTYGFCYVFTAFLENVGAHDFVATIWSFHFVFGLLIALLVRKIFDKTKTAHVIDKGLMTRWMGVFLDYLVVGAVAAISITIVGQYWRSILFMSLLAGPATFGILYYFCYRAFDDYHFERFVELWGEMTGTINSALVLLRVTDPEFKTPVAEDAVYGSGITLFLGIPLLVVLNVPTAFYKNAIEGYWVALGILLLYWLVAVIIWRAIGFLQFKRVVPKP
ncbi:MAG: sodium/glutamate symporter [Candidatus Neomarinimicrobiota bacterium]